MKKIIYLLFFVFLVNIAISLAAEQFPIQVYGDIDPDLPEQYDIAFEIDGTEFEAQPCQDDYGYSPLVKIPVDDNSTPAKEGYERGDSVDVLINDVLVDTQTYQYLPTDIEYVPYQIDIDLTTEEYDDITDTQTPTCSRSRCTSNACDSRSACQDAGCKWYNGDCYTPRSSSGGGGSPPSGGASGGCYDQWQCEPFGECSVLGKQTQTCVNIGTCREARPTKTETQDCTYVAPPPVVVEQPPVIVEQEPTPEVQVVEESEGKGFPWLIVILIVIGIGGSGAIIYEVERSRKHVAGEKQLHHSKVHPDTYGNLESYIKRTLEMGYTRAQIRQKLVQEGWSAPVLNKVFQRV